MRTGREKDSVSDVPMYNSLPVGGRNKKQSDKNEMQKSPLGLRKRVWYICCGEYVEYKWWPE